MKKFSFSLLFSGLLLLLTPFGCKDSTRTLLPMVSGSAYEAIVVMPKYQWDGNLGEKIRELYSYPISYFPDSEPILTLVPIPGDAFGGVFQSYRTIIFVNISPDYKKPKILLQKDTWAKPQIIFEFQAADEASMIRLLEDNQQNIMNRILAAERERTTDHFKKYFDNSIRTQLLKNHQLTLDVPKGYAIDVDSGQFVWIEQERGNNMLDLLIYYYPFHDTTQLTKEALLKKRNEILKRNVPGKDPGSYMTTEKIVDPVYEKVTVEGRQFTQLSGLWTIEKGFMGGPFVNITTVDSAHHRIVTVDGFVFAPNQKKRNWLFQLQSIAYTISFQK